MHYLSAQSIQKSYGVRTLFEDISFHIQEGDKIALVARNGSGKSTLLRILAGRDTVDQGQLWRHKDMRCAFFEQEPAFEEDRTVGENIFHYGNPVAELLRRYEEQVENPSLSPQAWNDLLMEMEEKEAWGYEAQVKQILGKLNIHRLDQKVSTLSGGQKKRVALARTLIDIGFQHQHVLLVMDEPTNHLDLSMVEWLEQYLNQERLTLILVTHDRYFLDAVCDRIWELEEGKLYVHQGNYAYYLEKKADRLERDQSSLDKARNAYRKELEWMRKQPKARTTKARSRIDRFDDLESRARQKTATDSLRLEMKMSRLGGKVAEMKKVRKRYGDTLILDGFDYTFKKGDRVGIIGANGTGKSTFLRLLQGLEPPDSGKINLGDTVVFGYFSQQGLEWEEDLRLIDYVKGIAEHFPLASGGSLSASQFLQWFLFPPEQQYTYISSLSGGEKKRLQLLAVLFRNPNFLILDEPTNDLDLPTLTLLEDFLSEFSGCLIIVSHDRYFMDRLVDHLFVFEGEGRVRDFPGTYSQYREAEEVQQYQERQALAREKLSSEDSGLPGGEEKPLAEKANSSRLSYKEKRELEALPQELEALEAEKARIESALEGGGHFEQISEWTERLAEIAEAVEAKEWRWLELSERAGDAGGG